MWRQVNDGNEQYKYKLIRHQYNIILIQIDAQSKLPEEQENGSKSGRVSNIVKLPLNFEAISTNPKPTIYRI